MTNYFRQIKNVFTFLIILQSTTAIAQQGSIDASFNVMDQGGTGEGASDMIFSTTPQADKKILIGGDFTSFNGNPASHIARLNTDGSFDNTFNTGLGANNTVMSIAVQTDGKILIAGDFTSFNGNLKNYILRLNSNGSIDNTFNSGIGPDDRINCISLQNDGKILIGGDFNKYNNIAAYYIARLNTDGTIDNSFNTNMGTNGSVNCIAQQSDGKILLGGFFDTYKGNIVNMICRINSNATIDNSFNVGDGADNDVNTIAVQSNGKIIVGGEFTTFNKVATQNIVRLNTNGSVDNTYLTGNGTDLSVFRILIQYDDKAIINGYFSNYNGNPAKNIARLNTDGTLDNSFDSGFGCEDNFMIGYIFSAFIQADGNIVIAGNFNHYDNNGKNHIARVMGDIKTSTENIANSIQLGNVFPNPSNGVITLNSPTILSNISVFDEVGKEILNAIPNSNSITINLNNYAEGIYFIQLKSKDELQNIKVVIEK